ncbi:alpha-amylase family glycosyl hydrolase [Paraurantiacibacter namhicola]|uniref:Oligo-1,6-glucosidase n=1 Tax=Paraurantiacibacter namhicola TaxID=645517 RepID=A0A1C7D738_9SPHN|nr:alpha-amylase family glycosyl hydrolase [Paraurantiacibacter namhicola]ANU07162.1 Oligo-1,6-glucosidase [Paraurantiacibacter namhicola]
MNRFVSMKSARADNGDAEWWRGAAIYQIYPRSFCDSNADGIGDLPGITQKLDHVASLGVDGIWISPFFTSPMKDFGYDVADYRDVDPIFGTLADFDALIARAHELGLKVLIDQVYAHTSDEHAWFEESRSSRDNPKADWYVWADAKPDGSPPSNWQSVFGGPAWTWDARRGQYYMHNFLSSQPQVNGHNPDVQQALLDVAKFWLDRGVDGFRIDALNFLMHDPQLRDNPPAPDNGKPRTRPFDYQLKVHNQSHKDIPAFIERIRALCDRYDAVFTVAEVGGDDAAREMKLFTQGDRRLNSAYGFNFLYADQLTPQLVCDALGEWPADGPEDGPDAGGAGWPSWAFENHDAPRAISRWCGPEHHDAFARMKAALLCSLRGNIIIYQGEELGLNQVEIPFEMLHDPEAIANWPQTLSRDGARTPMPWITQCENAGFGHAAPWLPVGDENAAKAVDRQGNDPASLLNHTRAMLELRARHPALRSGRVAACRCEGDVLVLDREADGQRVRFVANLSPETVTLPEGTVCGDVMAAINGVDGDTLAPYGAIFLQS